MASDEGAETRRTAFPPTRKSLGQHFLSRYFNRRAYYKLAVDRTVDNADQRMQEELSPFCTMISSIPRLVSH